MKKTKEQSEKSCAWCPDPTARFIFVEELDVYLCQRCWQRHRRQRCEIKHDLPAYGEVNLDDKGLPICHICGYAFKKVLSHATQVHGVQADEYKRRYGLYITKGVCCEDTKEKLRDAVTNNFDLVVAKNLIAKGQSTRFTEGGEGRTRDKMPEQLRRLLVARNKGLRPEVWSGRAAKILREG